MLIMLFMYGAGLFGVDMPIMSANTEQIGVTKCWRRTIMRLLRAVRTDQSLEQYVDRLGTLGMPDKLVREAISLANIGLACQDSDNSWAQKMIRLANYGRIVMIKPKYRYLRTREQRIKQDIARKKLSLQRRLRLAQQTTHCADQPDQSHQTMKPDSAGPTDEKVK